MAYMSFTPWETDAGAARKAIATADDVALFDALELRVIALGARSDIARERTHTSHMGRLLEKMFGIELDRPLANPRLEHLRRYASLLRHHPEQVGDADMGALIEAGFSRGQAYGLRHYLTDHGTGARRPAGA